ncbi:MAG: hypothetical protein HY711_04070 [Candidatus Melainabacteria bacterium]|nr:hypothetical protein [Candidatus Melainabacteria bacterium]
MKENWLDTDSEQDKKELKAYERPDSQSYDLSFAYKFKWECPDKDVHEAFKVLLCAGSSAQRGDSVGEALSQQELGRIQWLIAINPNTPPPVLDSLVHTGDPQLLERVAEHQRVSTSTLAKLARNTSPEVRAAVADNLNTSWETLKRLSCDEHPDVRFQLAENHRAPLEILRHLAQDENPYVAYRAQKTLHRLGSHELIQGQFSTPERPQSMNIKGSTTIAGLHWKQAP